MLTWLLIASIAVGIVVAVAVTSYETLGENQHAKEASQQTNRPPSPG